MLPLVRVEWTDARSKYDQLRISEAKKVPLCHRVTVGYLVLEDQERVIVAQTFDPAEPDEEEDGVADITVIPTGWVKGVTHLRTKPQKKAKAE